MRLCAPRVQHNSAGLLDMAVASVTGVTTIRCRGARADQADSFAAVGSDRRVSGRRDQQIDSFRANGA
jgi:hypothetical protein